jgi:hypothetical protein
LIGGVLEGDVTAEPQDVRFARFDLGLVVIVCFEVAMRQRTSVVRIRFVDVLWRDGDRGRDPGRENKDARATPEHMHEVRLWSAVGLRSIV